MTKHRGCLPRCTKVFLVCFLFCFLVVLLFVACVILLVFCKKAQKGYFPAILEFFCLFCFPKGPVLKCFFSSFSVFFPGFPSFFPFKIPCFSFVFVHQPTPFGKDSLWGFLLSFYFVFSFLNVCFFVWNNFLTSPFWTPSCFCFWHFFSCFFVFMVYVSAFLFWCWLCFVMFLFCFDIICLVSCSFAFRLWKHCFLAIPVFLVMLALK